MSTGRRRIALVVTHSFVARNYVHTGLAEALTRMFDASVEFVSTTDLGEIRSPSGIVYRHHHIPATADGRVDGVPRWLQRISGARRRLYAVEVENSGVVHGRMRAKILGRNPLRRAAVTAGISVIRAVLPRHSRIRTWIRNRIETAAARAVTPSKLFADGTWALAVVGSPGHYPLDALVAWQARKVGIPVTCVMASWDNMITKGPLIARVDRIAVWNGEMQEQARLLHGYPRSRTPAVGTLSLEIYGTSRNPADEAASLARVGVEPGKYILYLGSQRAPEYEIEDVVALAAALRRSPRFADLTLLVRNHPAVPSDVFAKLAGDGIVLDRAPKWGAAGVDMLSFDRSAMEHMRALLANAHAVVASWGTTGLIEAAIMDRPAVQLAWMDAIPRELPEQAATMRALQQYAHVAPMNESGAHLVSTRPGEVSALLERLLDNPELFRARRRLMLARLVAQPFGEVVDRLVGDCSLMLEARARSGGAQ